MTNDEIRRGGPADLPLLERLWVSVHHRHAESMPELAPYVDDATTWAVRGAFYAELLAKPDTVLLLASAGDEVVGYGLAHVMPARRTRGSPTPGSPGSGWGRSSRSPCSPSTAAAASARG